jgi:hypothetical protein
MFDDDFRSYDHYGDDLTRAIAGIEPYASIYGFDHD